MILENGDYFMVMLKEEFDNNPSLEGLGVESVNSELISVDARGLYGRILKLEAVDEAGVVSLVSLIERGGDGKDPYMVPLLLKAFEIIPVPTHMAKTLQSSRKNYEKLSLSETDILAAFEKEAENNEL
jgi:hypothetical protein